MNGSLSINLGDFDCHANWNKHTSDNNEFKLMSSSGSLILQMKTF